MARRRPDQARSGRPPASAHPVAKADGGAFQSGVADTRTWLTGLVSTVQHVLGLAEGRAGEATVKLAFAILLTRWFLVLVPIYTHGVLLGRFGLCVVVLAYAAASIWSEIVPERFARLIPDRRPAELRQPDWRGD